MSMQSSGELAAVVLNKRIITVKTVGQSSERAILGIPKSALRAWHVRPKASLDFEIAPDTPYSYAIFRPASGNVARPDIVRPVVSKMGQVSLPSDFLGESLIRGANAATAIRCGRLAVIATTEVVSSRARMVAIGETAIVGQYVHEAPPAPLEEILAEIDAAPASKEVAATAMTALFFAAMFPRVVNRPQQ